jgi:hypothetical protein
MKRQVTVRGIGPHSASVTVYKEPNTTSGWATRLYQEWGRLWTLPCTCPPGWEEASIPLSTQPSLFCGPALEPSLPASHSELHTYSAVC